VRDLRATGLVDAMTLTWSPPATNPGAVSGYVVAVAGGPTRTLPASARGVTLTGLPRATSTFGVTVTATGAPGQAATRSVSVPRGYPTISAKRHLSRLRVKGVVRAASRPVAAAVVSIQRKTPTGWVTVRSVRTGSDGSYATSFRRRKLAYYRVVFLGSSGAVGTTSARHRW
jgi:hypothetical protein